MKFALRVCVFLLMARASVCADITVTAAEGGEAVINCPYYGGYETSIKYFYKGPYRTNNPILQADGGKSVSNGRFTLKDDPKVRLFTVTIRDLEMSDAGLYGCAPGWGDMRLVQLNVVKAVRKPKPDQIFTTTIYPVHQGAGRTRIVIGVASGGLFIITILLLIIRLKRMNRRSAVNEYENDGVRVNTYAALELQSRSSDLYNTLTTVHPSPAVHQTSSSEYENLSVNGRSAVDLH